MDKLEEKKLEFFDWIVEKIHFEDPNTMIICCPEEDPEYQECRQFIYDLNTVESIFSCKI